MKYICLLRGINVSGQKKILMKELKVMFEKLNFDSVQTYIQSGNIIFESDQKNIGKLSEQIKAEIKTTFGYDVQTFVESDEFFTYLKNSNPFFTNESIDISKLHVTILDKKPDVAQTETTHKNDEWILFQNLIYLHCPDGYGRTKFTNTFFEKTFKCSATTRNWKTISKLVELSSY